MASYGESAAARIRFDDDALANAYLKAGELMKGTLQGIADKERQNYKDKLEQERLDREEARQAEQDRKANILFDQAQEDRAKEVLTKTEANEQAKIGTMGYQEGAGLLGKYAKAATDFADLAYDKVEAETRNADLAIEAYSKAFNEIAPKQWEAQQKEIKYNNSLIDAARRAHLENVERPVDATKLTQLLEVSDKPILQKQLESKDELAAQLLAPETTVKGIAKANETFKSIVGAPMSSAFLNTAIANAKNQEFQAAQQKDQQRFTANQNNLTRKANKEEREYNTNAKQNTAINDSKQAGNTADALAKDNNIKIPNTITEGTAKLNYVKIRLSNKTSSTNGNATSNIQAILDNAKPGWIDSPAAFDEWSKVIGKPITINGVQKTITPKMAEDALKVSLRRNKTFDLDFLQGVDTDPDSIKDTIEEVYLYNHPFGN